MKRPVIDAYDRDILKMHREGHTTLAGALVELDIATLRLKREVCKLLLDIHHKMQGK